MDLLYRSQGPHNICSWSYSGLLVLSCLDPRRNSIMHQKDFLQICMVRVKFGLHTPMGGMWQNRHAQSYVVMGIEEYMYIFSCSCSQMWLSPSNYLNSMATIIINKYVSPLSVEDWVSWVDKPCHNTLVIWHAVLNTWKTICNSLV